LFGPPTLIQGEKRADYEALQTRVTNSVKPKDVIEEIWVDDIVHLTWEILRLRRIKAAFLTAVQLEGMEAVLRQVLREGPSAAGALAKQWAARDADAIKEVDDLLSANGLSMNDAVARGLAARISPFERMDAVMSNLETRRNTTLREIQRYRASSASALCDATSDEAVDAEFQDVTPAPSGKAA
jgi:hypothetical protein